MSDLPDLLSLADRVATVARELEIEVALIGGLAVAFNGYVRATTDADLVTYVDPFPFLRRLEESLNAQGFKTKVTFPDDDDDLGGKVKVWEREDDDGDPIGACEVVNFKNPWRSRKTPALRALTNARPVGGSTSLRCVGLVDLIAFKLDTGATKDRGDVVELLVHNPDADLDEIREIAGPFDRANVLESLILEAAQTQR